MSTVIKLFISFNKNQNNAIQDIVNHDIIKHKTNDSIKNNFFLVTTMTNYPKYFPDENICVLKFEKSIKYFLNEIYHKSLLHQINVFLSDHILVHRNTEVITPHLMNIPSNYIVNKLYRECLNIIISNYPDGIAQLYDAKIRWKYKYDLNIYKVLIRYIIANLIGLRYKLVYGSILNSYKRLNNTYTYAKDLLPKNLNSNIIQITHNTKKVIGKSVIIICFAPRFSIAHYIKTFFDVQYPKIDQNISKIYYKPHPAVANDTFQTLIRKYDYPIIIIDKNELLEESVTKYQCNQVISIGTFSTALLNLRLIYGEQIQLTMFEIAGQAKGKNYEALIRIIDYFKIDRHILH